MKIQWLGRVRFEEALALQEEIVARKIDAPGAADELLLLEHEPVYTIGRNPDQSSLRGAEHLPHPVVQISRGGQATYHGPGQLVGYPILDLKTRGQDLHRYLRAIEDFIVATCGDFGVEASRREGLTGAWVGERKIASIGVGVRRWISMHGFSLNVCGDLAPYRQITPCGIAGVEMTSLERESGASTAVRDVAEYVSRVFESGFGLPRGG